MAKAKLIFIHGRAQEGKSEQELLTEWLTPLRQTLAERGSILDEVEIVAPFYGDRLIELLNSLGDAVPDDIIVRGDAEGINEDYSKFLGEYLEEIRLNQGVTDDEIASLSNDRFAQRGLSNKRWFLNLLRALNKIPGLDGDMIERVLRDVWIYLERRTVRKDINSIIESAFDTHLPIVVVGHSLGTIIGYDIIRGRVSGVVPKLVTLGSPLGLKIVQEALAPIKHPKIVKHWFNSRDPRDLVALYPLTKEHFDVDPEISDNSEVINRTSNAHGISGYLSDKATVDQIYDALTAAINS